MTLTSTWKCEVIFTLANGEQYIVDTRLGLFSENTTRHTLEDMAGNDDSPVVKASVCALDVIDANVLPSWFTKCNGKFYWSRFWCDECGEGDGGGYHSTGCKNE